MLGEVGNWIAIWWPVALGILVPKIIKIRWSFPKLQLKMSGSLFFWDTVYKRWWCGLLGDMMIINHERRQSVKSCLCTECMYWLQLSRPRVNIRCETQVIVIQLVEMRGCHWFKSCHVKFIDYPGQWMTGRIETPDKTTLLINQNNHFMRYANTYCQVIGASKYIFNF